ncbi:MAG TPA: lipocalin-like domain-containing protein [Roseiarcus sp.]|nr:lipocalin-like domain-containing protein [Roseiarcus sp.]
MSPLVGVWRLVAENAWSAAGEPRPNLYGPMGMGLLSFTHDGRMMAALSDGRPGPIDGARAFVSYCGAYAFDGARLVTHVDGASDPLFFKEPQVRDARLEGDRLTLRPPAGFRGASDLVRELVWERIST